MQKGKEENDDTDSLSLCSTCLSSVLLTVNVLLHAHMRYFCIFNRLVLFDTGFIFSEL